MYLRTSGPTEQKMGGGVFTLVSVVVNIEIKGVTKARASVLPLKLHLQTPVTF